MTQTNHSPQQPVRLSQAFAPEGLANERQREHFCDRAERILSMGETPEDVAYYCLREVWQSYDMWGHSVGRSQRALLLERAIDHLRDKRSDRAAKCLSVLLAMYYDPKYIAEAKWYDFPNEGFPYARFDETIYLTIAGLSLDIDELPAIGRSVATMIYDLVSKESP